jgi:DNA/RNA-binding domain of Phe-tRNA-synthetase-like protein
MLNIPGVRFRVHKEDLSLATIFISDIKIDDSTPAFTEFEQRIFDEIQSRHSLESLKDDPILRSYRDLYWRFGMDPTKLRVSSEALLRRILRGENLWRVNNLVDSMNVVSAFHRIPIGLADLHKIAGDLEVRQAKKGESFTRIGGTRIQCRGRELVIADQEKITCFGFATHDSNHTKITKKTESALVYLCLSGDVPTQVRDNSLQLTIGYLKRWVPCEVVQVVTAKS